MFLVRRDIVIVFTLFLYYFGPKQIVQKPYFERNNMKQIPFFKIFFIFCALSFDANIYSRSPKKQKERKDDYKYSPGDASFNRTFIEDSFKNHPLVFTMSVAALITTYLYPVEIKKFIIDNRHSIACGSFLSLAMMYLNKDKIIASLPCDREEEEEDGFLSFARSGVRIFGPGVISTRFKDVAGLDSAKEDLFDILNFLKDPRKFIEMGAHVPKGVLLSGSPGNGKTLLARALAGETDCPFLYINASEFIEAIVGIGASRMRNLFAIAKELSPCIIFIDEIDAIGRKRVAHGSGGDNELTQTLNQLLAEMDGFEQQENPIIIIGATNRSDVLDPALMRPGRFDRKITIDAPFKKDRIKILKVHLKKVKTSFDLDVEKIAQGTTGFSGAQLAQLVNEAAILAVRQGQRFITMSHIDQARDFMFLGRETRGMEISNLEFWKTAVHESGHALAHVYQELATPLYKVTIIPRGGAMGLTFGIEIKERHSRYQEEMLAEIVVALAGSVAEEIIYGGRGAGASSDLAAARRIATEMVMHYGMTDEFKDVTFAEFIHNQDHLPGDIATKLHNEVAKIIAQCRAVAHEIIFDHQDKLMDLVDMLMEDGTVFGKDVYELCGIKQPEAIYSLSV
jgi:cell division protease FtsH